MKRTTISLPDDLALALERETRRRHTSASAVAREALARYLGLAQDGEPRKLSFIGIGRSGHSDTAARAEEILAEEWADSIARDR